MAHDSTPSISSPASPQGFHTPVEDDVPRLGGSLLQAPTPTSAILSRSLDGYLEPQRMSFGSPPASELHRAPSLDDSFPVFSPPPYGAVVMRHGSHRGNRNSIGPPWLGPMATPRQSIVSNTSPKSHHTCTVFINVSIQKKGTCPLAFFAQYISFSIYVNTYITRLIACLLHA